MTLRQSNYLQYAPKYGKEENFWSSLTGWALNLKTVIISLGFLKSGQDFRFWHRIGKNPLSARNGMLCWHLILKQSFYAIIVNFRPSKQSNSREADTPRRDTEDTYLKTLSRTESFLGAERKMVSDNFFKCTGCYFKNNYPWINTLHKEVLSVGSCLVHVARLQKWSWEAQKYWKMKNVSWKVDFPYTLPLSMQW